jgi:hypothetical protein
MLKGLLQSFSKFECLLGICFELPLFFIKAEAMLSFSCVVKKNIALTLLPSAPNQLYLFCRLKSANEVSSIAQKLIRKKNP